MPARTAYGPRRVLQGLADNLSTAICTSFSTLPPFPGETIAIASVLAHHSRAPPATSACRDPFRVRNGSSSAQVVSVVLILLQVFTVASFVRLTSPSGLHTSVAVRTLRRHARLGCSSFVRLYRTRSRPRPVDAVTSSSVRFTASFLGGH
ncbi:hypothetical protein C8R46DRAFT_1227996 [Mycena filopes]|nr:hypothetical protein C8R46DRAFT_1227996 [Mycena filopes]